MSSAIWALAYDIRTEDKPVYLDWFHNKHIAEKLARDGYQWPRIIGANRIMLMAMKVPAIWRC